MKPMMVCRLEWCGAPRNATGYCPGHARMMAGEVGRWEPGSEYERARSRVREQCRKAGVPYSPTPPPSPRSGPTKA